jgi:heme exporter protein CcmD
VSALALAAGKYGAFIWPAYGFTAVVFAWMILGALWRASRFRRQAEDRQKKRGR